MKLRVLSSIVCFFCINFFISQDVLFEKSFFSKDQRDGLKEAQKSIKEGDLIYELGASVWPRAIEHYKKAYDFNPDNSLLNYKLGTCYLYSIHKSWALDFLKKAYSLNPSVNQKIHFFLGKAHHFKYEFDDAIKEFEKHKKVLINTGNQDQLIDLSKMISDCRFAKKLIADPERVWIDNLGPQINTFSL